jgi:hypothetical protein
MPIKMGSTTYVTSSSLHFLAQLLVFEMRSFDFSTSLAIEYPREKSGFVMLTCLKTSTSALLSMYDQFRSYCCMGSS